MHHFLYTKTAVASAHTHFPVLAPALTSSDERDPRLHLSIGVSVARMVCATIIDGSEMTEINAQQ